MRDLMPAPHEFLAQIEPHFFNGPSKNRWHGQKRALNDSDAHEINPPNLGGESRLKVQSQNPPPRREFENAFENNAARPLASSLALLSKARSIDETIAVCLLHSRVRRNPPHLR